jgi:hypothetical protein
MATCLHCYSICKFEPRFVQNTFEDSIEVGQSESVPWIQQEQTTAQPQIVVIAERINILALIPGQCRISRDKERWQDDNCILFTEFPPKRVQGTKRIWYYSFAIKNASSDSCTVGIPDNAFSV